MKLKIIEEAKSYLCIFAADLSAAFAKIRPKFFPVYVGELGPESES